MGVSTLKERIKEEILIYGLLQLSSLIYHAVPVHSSITPWEGAFSLRSLLWSRTLILMFGEEAEALCSPLPLCFIVTAPTPKPPPG